MAEALPPPVLDRLFRPKRIALVGASDKNVFSRRAVQQQERVGAEEMVLVNPRSPLVHGRETVSSCAEIAGGIDCAYLMVPGERTADALADAAAAGAGAAVILSQGWAEAGADGRERQDALVAQARDLGMVLLGPNHLGFANLRDRVACCAVTPDLPVEPGAFALLSQSGALASSMADYAARHGVTFSHVITTGNEAMVTVTDALSWVLDDPGTRAVGIFAETLRKPDAFRAALEKAADLGKAVVILKAGTSEHAARAAEAHTGALVGDDRVISAVFRQHGVIRVRTCEDLLATGSLCAGIGPLSTPDVGVLSISGGANDLLADRAQDEGWAFAALADTTSSRLGELLPAYGHAQNPVDLTGAALADPTMWTRSVRALSADPAVGLIGIVTGMPRPDETGRSDAFDAIGAGTDGSTPVVVCPQIEQEQGEFARRAGREAGLDHVVPSVERFAVAAGGLSRWSAWLRDRRAAPLGGSAPATNATSVRMNATNATSVPPDNPPLGTNVPSVSMNATNATSVRPGSVRGALPVGEVAGRGALAEAGVPVVPGTLVDSEADAVSAALEHPGPVVLKLAAASVAHKTEIGGVELGVEGSDAVRAAYGRIVAEAAAAGVEPDGVLVSPMRTGGLDLLAGVVRDPQWGLVLAVGFGGVLVEVLDDSALAVLPVDRREVRRMLDGLRGARLLDGYRGGAAVDRDRLADVIVRIAGLAGALGPGLTSLEVNPLRADGDRIEALDVLVT